MANVDKLTSLIIDTRHYEVIKNLDSSHINEFKNLKIVKDAKEKHFLLAEYEIYEQKEFFRSINFLTQCEHPTITQLRGFAFNNHNEDDPSLVTLTDYPPNGFLTDFMEKVKKGLFPKFDNTSKSKFLFGATFVGYLLHSRGIVHRFLAPPSFGVTENYEPILMTMSFLKRNKILFLAIGQPPKLTTPIPSTKLNSTIEQTFFHLAQ